MKLEPVTKLDNRNKTTSKKFKMTLFWQTVRSLSFYQFMVNLEQSQSMIPDV